MGKLPNRPAPSQPSQPEGPQDSEQAPRSSLRMSLETDAQAAAQVTGNDPLHICFLMGWVCLLTFRFRRWATERQCRQQVREDAVAFGGHAVVHC